MKLRIRNTRLTLQVIGWLQMIGGIFGLFLMAYLMLKTGAINGGVLLIFCMGIFLFSYSIYCGKRLIWDKQKETGIICSVINYFLQLFQWIVVGCGITYSSGAAITIGISKTVLNFTAGAVFTNFSMSINSDDDFFIKLNLFALLIIIVLFDMLKELKTEKSKVAENINAPELSQL
ncbi:MAG: hypothetical protein ABJB05_03145 [Parafilimonas sp.]